ncbi:MAG TPA: DNA double-strand break repair nuclease NurA, partial [Anaerolineae bacterium]
VRNSARAAGEQLTRIAKALDRMRRSGAIIAGYIDRPNSNALARSCALTEAPAASIHDETQLRKYIKSAEKNMLGIVDRTLLESLLPGTHRTALFEPTWLINGTNYLGKFGHTMRCCYVNIAKEGARPQLARMEMPIWCADEQSVAIATAVMGRHARMGGGYPLCLKAAHEEAVLSYQDEREIDQILEGSLIERGILATPSAKQEAKDRH